jgi:flagellar biosynthesis protein FliQ
VVAIVFTLTLIGGFMLTQLTDFAHLIFDSLIKAGG